MPMTREQIAAGEARRAQARRDRHYYGTCGECGGPLGYRNAGKVCADCRAAAAQDRAQAMVDAWLAGRMVADIANEHDVSTRVVSATFEKLRAAGMRLPRRRATALTNMIWWRDPVPIALTVEPGMLSRGAQELRRRARENRTTDEKELDHG